MQAKIILLVTFGLVLVLSSASGTLMFVRQAEGRVAQVEERLRTYGTQVRLPTLARDVKRGDVLQAADFTYVSVPASIAPAGVLERLPSAEHGLVALVDIASHRLILPHQLGLDPARSATTTLPSADPNVMRIRPVNLDEVIPGLQPGDSVDVFWVRSIGGGSFETRLLGSTLRIIDAIAPSDDTQGQAGWVTIGASAEVVARLLQARSAGELYVAVSGTVRHDPDGEIVVDDEALKSLPLVERHVEVVREVPVVTEPEVPDSSEQASRTATGSPTDTLTYFAQRALEASQSATEPPKRCTLTVVRGGERSVLEVPCR